MVSDRSAFPDITDEVRPYSNHSGRSEDERVEAASATGEKRESGLPETFPGRKKKTTDRISPEEH